MKYDTLNTLHVIGTLDPRYGGPVSALRSLIPALADVRVKATVLSLDPPDATWLRLSAARILAIGPVRGRFGSAAYNYTPALGSWLRLNARQYDAVVIHGIWQYQSFGVWRAL